VGYEITLYNKAVVTLKCLKGKKTGRYF
jgi:hypothetical protein